jgi:hydrogenase maturation protease
VIRVLGLGEPARGDDVVGPVVAEAVRADPGVDVVIARDALALVDALLDADHVVLVDAVLADPAPGTVLTLTEDRLDRDVRAVSTHVTAVPTAIALARALGATARLDVVGVVVGVLVAPEAEPRVGLSDAVRAAVPAAVAAVRALVEPPEAPTTLVDGARSGTGA